MQPLEARLKDVTEEDREKFLKNIVKAIESDYFVEKIPGIEAAPREILSREINQQLQEDNWKKIYNEYNLFILTKVWYGIDMMTPKNIPADIFFNMGLNEKMALYGGIFIENKKTSKSILKEGIEKLSLQEVSDVLGYLISTGIDYLKRTHKREMYGYISDPNQMPFKSIEVNSRYLRERFNRNRINHYEDQRYLAALETQNFFTIMGIYNASKNFGPRSKAKSVAIKRLNDLDFDIPASYYKSMPKSERESILKRYGSEALDYINKKIKSKTEDQLNLL